MSQITTAFPPPPAPTVGKCYGTGLELTPCWRRVSPERNPVVVADFFVLHLDWAALTLAVTDIGT